MAYSYTIDAESTTGRMKKTRSVGNQYTRHLLLYTGTFDMGTDTNGDIDLTDSTKTNIDKIATKILAYDVLVGAGTSTEQLCSKPNWSGTTGAGSAVDGIISITVAAADNTGTWWALVEV